MDLHIVLLDHSLKINKEYKNLKKHKIPDIFMLLDHSLKINKEYKSLKKHKIPDIFMETK